MDAIRAHLGGSDKGVRTMTPEQRRVAAEQQILASKMARIRRVDAQIPFDRRWHYVPVHPRRREGD